MSKRWMSSGYLRGAPSGKVDRESGIIEGVSVCTVGEAKGHGVNLDQEFVDTVVRFGAARKQGLKARFGHPNMCSTALGTFIGRFKNFRGEGEQARADLFLSNEAKDTPHGNLYDYVLGMAENEPDMFGTSIVFTPGAYYRRNAAGEKVYPHKQNGEWNEEYDKAGGPEYIECEELHACDAVDDPAANDGLFSKFSQETMAGQITEFLDLHPQVWEAIKANPSIVEALGRYGDKVDEFITRYREYRGQSKETAMSDQTPEVAEPTGEAVEALEAAETPEAIEETELAAAEPTAEPVSAGEPTAESAPDDPSVVLTTERDEYRRLHAEASERVTQLEGEAQGMREQIEALTVDLTEQTARAVQAETERDELRRKLAVIEQGAPPASAAPAPVDELTPWQKAQRAARK